MCAFGPKELFSVDDKKQVTRYLQGLFLINMIAMPVESKVCKIIFYTVVTAYTTLWLSFSENDIDILSAVYSALLANRTKQSLVVEISMSV